MKRPPEPEALNPAMALRLQPEISGVGSLI